MPMSTNGSKSSSSTEHGLTMSNFPSTVGCTTPMTPILFPSRTIPACRPGKYVASFRDVSRVYPASPSFAAPVICITRSSAPCATSNPLVVLLYNTSNRLLFLAPTSLLSSRRTTSPTSKSFAGTGASLFAPIAFNTPCNKDDLATCTSNELGFATIAAQSPSSSRLTLAKLSSCEQRIHVSTSLNPCDAISWRTRSEKLFSGCCAPTVTTLGPAFSLLMLLYPYAMATSSATSHGWRMSDRVGGTSTRSTSPSIFVGSCMRQSSAAMALVSMSAAVTPMRFRT
mmetsp:Transcript_2384/g.10906  ORF Transcript_2384/g.10906 Transcript_2384/m.10906 type:complete len:284 (+) Transcript_2384:69-920(+)